MLQLWPLCCWKQCNRNGSPVMPRLFIKWMQAIEVHCSTVCNGESVSLTGGVPLALSGNVLFSKSFLPIDWYLFMQPIGFLCFYSVKYQQMSSWISNASTRARRDSWITSYPIEASAVPPLYRIRMIRATCSMRTGPSVCLCMGTFIS